MANKTVSFEVDIHVEDILEYINENYDPDDVFEKWELEEWAEKKNGYVKEED